MNTKSLLKFVGKFPHKFLVNLCTSKATVMFRESATGQLATKGGQIDCRTFAEYNCMGSWIGLVFRKVRDNLIGSSLISTNGSTKHVSIL